MKPRYSHHADGRVGLPDICVYQFTAGPRVGERVDVPPKLPEDQMPAEAILEQAHQRGWTNPTMTRTWPFRIIVLDLPAFQKLAAEGFWAGPLHCGPRAAAVDNRRAPG